MQSTAFTGNSHTDDKSTLTKEIMFTGIIEEVGRVEAINRRATSAVLEVLASQGLGEHAAWRQYRCERRLSHCSPPICGRLSS